MFMLRFIALLFLIFSTTFLLTNEVFAKRFGGGKSFGMQRSSMAQRQPSSFANQSHHNTHAQPTSSNRFGKWGAALAGLALGGLLSYLFMGHGIGASLLS